MGVSSIDKVYDNIKSVRIQGATNVAIAVAEAMKRYIETTKEVSPKIIGEQVLQIGNLLANARQNEPLARNLVEYVEIQSKKFDGETVGDYSSYVSGVLDDFMGMLKQAKRSMIDHGTELLHDKNTILTHCHSSSTENILKGLFILNKNLKIIATETRPLYQGRITTTNLIKAGLDVSMVVDDAVASLLILGQYGDVDALLIGCDEMSYKGDIINKVGSLSMALAAKEAGKPIYVTTTLLKTNLQWDGTSNGKVIEQRSSVEVWEDAPNGLNIINPAFDIVPNRYITGYITEAGLLSANELKSRLHTVYNWLM